MVSHSLLCSSWGVLTICRRITIEAALSVFQGYEQLALYKDLFEARDRDEETWRNNHTNTLQFDTRVVPGVPEDDAKRTAIPPSIDSASFEEELIQSIQIRDREALELVFGVPLPVRVFP